MAVGAGLVIAGVYVPVRAAQAALGVLGLTVGRFIPGGVVFNSSPQFTPLVGSRAVVWGDNGNENKWLQNYNDFYGSHSSYFANIFSLKSYCQHHNQSTSRSCDF